MLTLFKITSLEGSHFSTEYREGKGICTEWNPLLAKHDYYIDTSIFEFIIVFRGN